MKHLLKPLLCMIAAAIYLGTITPLTFGQDDRVEPREQPVQELFQNGLVYPQERGEVQLSLTSRFSKGKDHSTLQRPLSVEYGITDRWQIEVEWDARSRRSNFGEPSSQGTGDLSIGTQYSFMNIRGSDFHGAVGVEINLPTGNVEKSLSEGFIEYEPYVIIAKDFPKLHNLQVFSQVGVSLLERTRKVEEEGPIAHNFNAGGGVFVPFRHLVLTGELNLSTNRWNNGGTEREFYVTPGVVWRLPRNFEIGLGVPRGLNRDSDKSGAIFRLVYEFDTRGR